MNKAEKKEKMRIRVTRDPHDPLSLSQDLVIVTQVPTRINAKGIETLCLPFF